MGEGKAERRLLGLVETGALRFVYVVGVARSNSTLVCRLLGERLDGAVYEPAMPNSHRPRDHYARTILRAYDQARRLVPAGEPVALAIKDLSLFLDARSFAFIAAHAERIVFTLREPVAQHSSLMRQFGLEFGVLQRLSAVVGHPFEAFWMAWYFLVYGQRFLREATAVLGRGRGPRHRMAMAGWSLASWRSIAAQIAAAGDAPVTVFDAAQMRRDPAAAAREIAAITEAVKPQGIGLAVEVEGHSRMHPNASWAIEARASRTIKPMGTAAAQRRMGPVEEELARHVTPVYDRLVASPANPLRTEDTRSLLDWPS